MGDHGRAQTAEPVRRRKGIVVEIGHEITGAHLGQARQPIARGGRADVDGKADDMQPPPQALLPAGKHGSRVVAAAVVQGEKLRSAADRGERAVGFGQGGQGRVQEPGVIIGIEQHGKRARQRRMGGVRARGQIMQPAKGQRVPGARRDHGGKRGHGPVPVAKAQQGLGQKLARGAGGKSGQKRQTGVARGRGPAGEQIECGSGQRAKRSKRAIEAGKRVADAVEKLAARAVRPEDHGREHGQAVKRQRVLRRFLVAREQVGKHLGNVAPRGQAVEIRVRRGGLCGNGHGPCACGQGGRQKGPGLVARGDKRRRFGPKRRAFKDAARQCVGQGGMPWPGGQGGVPRRSQSRTIAADQKPAGQVLRQAGKRRHVICGCRRGHPPTLRRSRA